MSKVTVADQEFYIDDRGEGDAILFLHGFPFSSAMWEYQLSAFATKYRVVAIDLPGFGLSPAAERPEDASMSGWADLLAGVITELGLNKPVVVSTAMGGYLAFELLRNHSDLVGPQVFVATRAKSDDSAAWQARTEQQSSIRDGEDVTVIAKGMVESLLSQGSLDRSELVEYVLALMGQVSTEGWVAGLAAMKNRADAMGALRGVPHKSLVVAGQLDRITTLADSTLITRLVTDATLVTVDDSAHLPNIENPVRFNELVGEFLETVYGEIVPEETEESNDEAKSGDPETSPEISPAELGDGVDVETTEPDSV